MRLEGAMDLLPGLAERLAAGATVLVVGAAAALPELAARFPRSNFVGFAGAAPAPRHRRPNLRWARRGPAHLVDVARFDVVFVAVALGADAPDALPRLREALRLDGVLVLRDRSARLRDLLAAGLRDIRPTAGYLVARR